MLKNCCANCWPVNHSVSVDVLENRVHLLLWLFFMATVGLAGAKTKVMLPMRRSYLSRADSSCPCALQLAHGGIAA